ncbi:MAG: class I SAM-dependent methyltransferase [Flavobacteriaceae bacterium]|jgi:ubiquinone/menaquinone biosynthesis C-methylase UbiE|nr:class I SAM-dependent methyltransferase [Flavobacteriaceae bacterium]
MNDFIKSFWENQALKYGQSHIASWGDIYCINLEIDNIANYIHQGDSVLDIGCANGFSAIAQCGKKKLSSMTGVDFSENMIAYANQNKQESNYRDILNFSVADICNLPFEDNTFDVVYTTRVLINLPSWEEQKTGISECLRVIKKGGRFILCEGFWEPLCRLNAIRLLAGLSPLVEHDFNRYLKKVMLESYLTSLEYSFDNVDFSSIYYLGSRVFRELVTDYESYEGFSNPINEEFFKIQSHYSGGGFGIQQLYAIEK